MQNIVFTSSVTNTIQVKVSGRVFVRYSCESQSFCKKCGLNIRENKNNDTNIYS